MKSIDANDCFDVFECAAIVEGHCVLLYNNMIVYGGPIGIAPPPSKGETLLLHENDFAKLQQVVHKHMN